jgi:hypothetical protein
MSINFGNVNAGNMNVAGRDLTVGGDQHAELTIHQVRAAADELKKAVNDLHLNHEVAQEADQLLSGLSDELQSSAPNKEKAGPVFRRLVRLLEESGHALTATSSVLSPALTIAGWLGLALT